MKFDIIPYKGAGMLNLGITSEQAEEILNLKARKFKKTPFSSSYTDVFKYCHIYYDASGKCEAIEFFEPSEVVFEGVSMIGKSYKEILNTMRLLDDTLNCNDTGFTSKKYGFGVYAPFASKAPYEPIEGVIVFVKGYYDS